MNEATALLFDEFAVRYRRGERPDVLDYLDRAGDERDALADLIDRFLEAAPARKTSEEEVVLVEARLSSEPPILVLRRRRALARDTVVDALVRALGLDPSKRSNVGRYYHELETGLLDPAPVDSSVWTALAEFLRANVRALADFRPPPLSAPVARRSMDSGWVLAERLSAPATAAEEAQDEVDRLFTGST
jgi:hypothetical protein